MQYVAQSIPEFSHTIDLRVCDSGLEGYSFDFSKNVLLALSCEGHSDRTKLLSFFVSSVSFGRFRF